MDITPEQAKNQLIQQGLFSFEPTPIDTTVKHVADDHKLKDIDELNDLFMKDLIEDIITTDSNLPTILEESNHNQTQSQVIKEIKEEIADEALSDLLKNKPIEQNSIEAMTFEDIEKSIISDTINKPAIIQFSTHISNFTSTTLDQFLDFLSIDSRFFNLCKGSGFINLIKPIFQLTSLFSNDIDCIEDDRKDLEFKAKSFSSNSKIKGKMVDKFLSLFKNNLDTIIFDKKTYKIIEKLMKLPIEGEIINDIEQILLNNIYKYASNQYSCHVLKVLLSITPLIEKTSEYIYNQLKDNLLQYSQNKSCSSLVISSLYVSYIYNILGP